jgi:hypothetical protein
MWTHPGLLPGLRQHRERTAGWGQRQAGEPRLFSDQCLPYPELSDVPGADITVEAITSAARSYVNNGALQVGRGGRCRYAGAG